MNVNRDVVNQLKTTIGEHLYSFELPVALAELFVECMTEGHTDIANDEASDYQWAGDQTEAVREAAIDFSGDTLANLISRVKEIINVMKFQVTFEVTRKITSKLTIS